MKLSEKGVDKLYDSQLFGDVEFESDDFEGAIVLTVEEAKLAMRGLALGALMTNDLKKEMQYHWLAIEIEKRVEQVEGKK